MGPFSSKASSLGLLAIAFALLSIVAGADAQAPSPGATKNRLRIGIKLMERQPPTEIKIPDIPVNAAVAAAVRNTLISAPAIGQVQNPFADCIGKSCTWTVAPWPFVGMGLNPTSGAIFGTPTTIVQAHVQVVAVDQDGKSHQGKVFIAVVPQKPTILTTTLPAYPTGQPIREHLAIDGGVKPYLWTPVGAQQLPPGVLLDANGLLSGTANTAGTYKFTAAVSDSSAAPIAAASVDLELVIDPAPDCSNAKYTSTPYFNGWFPLSKTRNVNPLGEALRQLPTEHDVQCFYSTSAAVSPIGQVQYIYGFGGGANTISSDLVSVQMPAPVGAQVSFGSSVTAGGTTTTPQSGTTSSTSSTTGQSQPTVPAALQSVEAGGNFYIHALYPLAQYTSPHIAAYAYADPKIGFNFNGFANQATLSQATEQYFNAPAETYVSYEGIGNAGGIYLDYRGGLQSVPGSFAKNAGLPHHNFGLQQLNFGFSFTGFLRIGAQRFFGPSAAFNAADTSTNGFNKWHFVIQFSPKG